MANYYRNKDIRKFSGCDFIISDGMFGSSSHLYGENPDVLKQGLIANPNSYPEDSIVGISINGNRRGRMNGSLYEYPLRMAAEANATFVTDNAYDTARPYNVGEREIKAILEGMGYIPTSYPHRTIWSK